MRALGIRRILLIVGVGLEVLANGHNLVIALYVMLVEEMARHYNTRCYLCYVDGLKGHNYG